MRELTVTTNDSPAGTLVHTGERYDFTYYPDVSDVVSVTMPVRPNSWTSRNLHPAFQMNLPEGALKEVIREHFGKIRKMDDLGFLELLGPYMLGRVKFGEVRKMEEALSLDELLHPDGEAYFESLMEKFAVRSGISGIQPKVLIEAVNRSTMVLEHLIVKSWNTEWEELAANEYFCMHACKKAGLPTPDFYLSDDRRMFVMKRFDIEKGRYFGFEDMCVLLGKDVADKYESSYEEIAKWIRGAFRGERAKEYLELLFKAVVMNWLLRNGDAHLKNFGFIYDKGYEDLQMAPIYDVVTTTVYLPKDVPALKLSNGKLWWQSKTLHRFGKLTCKLSDARIDTIISECEAAVTETVALVDDYATRHPDFKLFGERLKACWKRTLV